jgi:large-conductance mechanosensitive channel
VLDLAIAVVIGAAFTAIVTSLVDNIITPIIGYVGGAPRPFGDHARAAADRQLPQSRSSRSC